MERYALAKERGQSLPQMALSWLLKDSDVTSVLIGASKPEQILSNIGIVGHTTFTKEELDLIDHPEKKAKIEPVKDRPMDMLFKL